MSANYPVLPVGGSALLRVFASVLAVVTHWLKEFARARRHRRQANVLAGLDRHMLADIGITRTDVRDAFSEPFWDDPTALLRERALERRLSHAVSEARTTRVDASGGRRQTGPHAKRCNEIKQTADPSHRPLDPTPANSPLAAGSSARRPLRRALNFRPKTLLTVLNDFV